MESKTETKERKECQKHWDAVKSSNILRTGVSERQRSEKESKIKVIFRESLINFFTHIPTLVLMLFK